MTLPSLNSFLLADCKTDSYLYHLPIDIKYNDLNDMKSIFNNFKDLDTNSFIEEKGKISTKNGYYFWIIYPSKLFIVGIKIIYKISKH